jgi:protein CWC15
MQREEKHKQSMANREAELLKGNPLIDSSYSLTKRWYEDTVFRNQAKKVEEKKSYINDYVRSDFHRKFMHRYICR